ncbi:MAG TPA: Rid family hydrolase [Mycobacterium sp.]|nr:Rid family hydrolase [Mycobacterium sp.]
MLQGNDPPQTARKVDMSNTFEAIGTGIAAHIGRYADAVRIPAGAEVIYTSGTPGLRPDGTLPEDFTEEVTQAWRNVEEALRRAGAALTDIVSVRQWLTDANDIPAYAAVRSKVITHEPVFMLAVIPPLVWPNIRVEVEVTAIRTP